MTSRWPVVIFDIDGTLVDSVDLIVASYQHAFRTVLGHEWDEAEIKTWIGQSLYGALERECPDHVDELFRVYIEWNEAHTAEWITAFTGIPELMTDLVAAGLKVGAATSKRRHQAQWALELGRVDAQLPLVVAHEDVATHKPDPAPLLLAAKKLGVTPDQAVYVGDATVDVQAAHNADMDVVAVTWGAGTRADLIAARPTALIDTVSDLGDALLRGCYS
ncbi:MAG: HAD-IA family hydrolase [Propionibacteriaceae bacterium]|nr:HAD-IA family hydrolase [Propionibacteriaceae bacterium]